MIDRSDRAVEFFKSGLNCSQSVFAAYAPDFGVDEKLAQRIAAAHGGGFGRLRELCGALTGAGMLAGLKFDDKMKVYETVQEMVRRFKDSNRSCICRELLGLDKAGEPNPKPEARTEGYYQTRPCVELVRQAAQIVAEVL